MMDYDDFLKQKQIKQKASGFDVENLSDRLFDFQKAIVKWALKKGKAAIFADTGLGKTFMQVEWAKKVNEFTNKQVLIVAPLCVAEQTINEAKKINIDISYLREYKNENIIITNYEMLDKFIEPLRSGCFSGIVLDESSILKHQDSKTRNKIIEISKFVDYRLSCTATPSPNDFMEFGSQSEFLGVMTSIEMLSMFFIHDSGETQKWRLKGHAKSKFWEWLSSWATYIKKPSDIGFDDDGFILPKLNISEIDIGGFGIYEDSSLQGRHKAKEISMDDRVEKTAEIVNNSKETFLIWCQRNDEGKKLNKLIKNSLEVSGNDSLDEKHDKIMKFTNKEARVLVTKPKIAGFGMNWQHCNNIIFVGLSDSYEQIYQAIRRCWRFGQKKDVNVFFINHIKERSMLKNMKRKEKQASEMSMQLVKQMADFQYKEINNLERENMNYETSEKKTEDFTLYLGDCIEQIKKIKDSSIDYSIFSPPFASLYTYTNSERDMGNCKNYDEFFFHFNFLVKELKRVLAEGRNISLHCMNLPTSKVKDGYIGIRDFRGDLIKSFVNEGFIFHSEIVIWKDPVVAMQRTKALGLLWKQLKKDSSMARQGIPDYIITFRKKGINKSPIKHTAEEFPVDLWQKYASPIWMDIKQGNVLNGKLARTDDDERHICPLQLDVIYRCLLLWSNKGDNILSPFAGIGSEGFVALQLNRKFIGIELKKSYYDYAIQNCEMAKKLPLLDYENGIIKKKIKSINYNNHDLNSFL